MSAHDWPEFEEHPTYNESYGDIQISKSEYNLARACVNGYAALQQQNAELLAALKRIEEYGHGIGHGSGYTCANIAEETIAKADAV